MPNELPQQFQTFLIFPSAKKTQDPPGQHQAKTTKNLHGGPGGKHHGHPKYQYYLMGDG